MSVNVIVPTPVIRHILPAGVFMSMDRAENMGAFPKLQSDFSRG